jgi:hypothetical protein
MSNLKPITFYLKQQKKMKTSNILITAALLILLGGLFYHDSQLGKLYRSGDYKNPLLGFVHLKYKDFDAVELTSSQIVNVKFIQGPFRVMADTNALSYIQIVQNDRSLQISAKAKTRNPYNRNTYVMVISCPKLKKLSTNTLYWINGKQETDTVTQQNWDNRKVLVQGFQQDSLHITQDYASSVILENNRLNLLSATIGQSPKSGSLLLVGYGNYIEKTDFTIRQKPQLILKGPGINQLNYQLTDSARLTVSGINQKLLKK